MWVLCLFSLPSLCFREKLNKLSRPTQASHQNNTLLGQNDSDLPNIYKGNAISALQTYIKKKNPGLPENMDQKGRRA